MIDAPRIQRVVLLASVMLAIGSTIAAQELVVGEDGNVQFPAAIRGIGAFAPEMIVLWGGPSTVIPEGWELGAGTNAGLHLMSASGAAPADPQPEPFVIDSDGNATFSGAISGVGAAMPGMIVMWGGAKDEIPEGWALRGASEGGLPLIVRVRQYPGAGPRYVDQGDGTVLDTRTQLTWLKDAGCLGETRPIGPDNLEQRIDEFNAGQRDFDCDGYSRGKYEDWRLPKLGELCGGWAGDCKGKYCCPAATGLVDQRFEEPAVANGTEQVRWSEGDVFVRVQSDAYWGAELYIVNLGSAKVSNTPYRSKGGRDVLEMALERGESIRSVERMLGMESLPHVWPVRNGR